MNDKQSGILYIEANGKTYELKYHHLQLLRHLRIYGAVPIDGIRQVDITTIKQARDMGLIRWRHDEWVLTTDGETVCKQLFAPYKQEESA